MLCARVASVYDQYGSEPIRSFLSDDPCVFGDGRETKHGSVRGVYIVVEETTLFIRMVRALS